MMCLWPPSDAQEWKLVIWGLRRCSRMLSTRTHSSCCSRCFKKFLKHMQQSCLPDCPRVEWELWLLPLEWMDRLRFHMHCSNPFFSPFAKGYIGLFSFSFIVFTLKQTSEKDERMICYIVNTAEYCHKTVSSLKQTVCYSCDDFFNSLFDLSKCPDTFTSVWYP